MLFISFSSFSEEKKLVFIYDQNEEIFYRNTLLFGKKGELYFNLGFSGWSFFKVLLKNGKAKIIWKEKNILVTDFLIKNHFLYLLSGVNHEYFGGAKNYRITQVNLAGKKIKEWHFILNTRPEDHYNNVPISISYFLDPIRIIHNGVSFYLLHPKVIENKNNIDDSENIPIPHRFNVKLKKAFQDIALSPDGRFFYLIDSKNYCIEKYDLTGNLVILWGKKGNQEGDFLKPFALAIDSKGYIYVLDLEKKEIQKFDSNGKFILMWKKEFDFLISVYKGKYQDQVSVYNAGLGIDRNDFIYLFENKSIIQFDSNGKEIEAFALPFSYKQPSDAEAKNPKIIIKEK